MTAPPSIRSLLWGVASLLISALGAVDLESAALAIHFDAAAQGYGIRGIVNKVADSTAFVRGNPDDAGNFWQLEFRHLGVVGTNESVWVDNLMPAASHRIETGAEGATFYWLGVDVGSERGVLDVAATVTLTPTGAAEWRIAVTNRSARQALGLVRYPVLADVVESEKADVLLPSEQYGAKVVKNFKPNWYSGYYKISPGWSPIMTAYQQGDAGLYLAAEDTEAHNTTIRWRNRSVFIETPVANAGVPGKAAGSPGFAVKTACYKGDWWQAAHLYRAWALQQRWTRKGPIAARRDYPKALAEVDVWLRVLGTDFSTLDRARRLWPDLKLGVRHYGWNVQRYDTHYPEFQPRPGVPEFWRRAAKDGVLVVPYCNGRLWDRNLRSFRYAQRDACAQANGEPFVEQWTANCAVMCPSCPDWQQTLLDMGTEIVTTHGANGIYYDQVNCARWEGCRNPAHGHPLEGGDWWQAGYRRAFEAIHARFAQAGVPVTSEGPCAYWMDLIDGALMVGRNKVTGDVPFYPAVYSGYTTYYCIEEESDDDVKAMFARQIEGTFWGAAGGSWDDRRLFEPDPKKRVLKEQAEVIHRCARFRKAAKAYLAYGMLQDQLRTEETISTVTFTHLPTRGRAQGKPATQVEYPEIVAYVWQTADGARKAVLAANVGDDTRTIHFRALGDTAQLRAVAGEAVPVFAVASGRCTLTLAPRGLAFVEFEDK